MVPGLRVGLDIHKTPPYSNGFIVTVLIITKTCLYNFDPLKPHFYIVKLGFTGVNISFLISAQNIDCGYSLEPPRRGGSNKYPQSMFLSRNMKNIRVFIWKFSVLGGEIFYIFELECFRNGGISAAFCLRLFVRMSLACSVFDKVLLCDVI